MKSHNTCHQCGATSYKPVIKRDETGAMSPSGLYQCTGCRLVFATVEEWRTGQTRTPVAHADEQQINP